MLSLVLERNVERWLAGVLTVVLGPGFVRWVLRRFGDAGGLALADLRPGVLQCSTTTDSTIEIEYTM